MYFNNGPSNLIKKIEEILNETDHLLSGPLSRGAVIISPGRYLWYSWLLGDLGGTCLTNWDEMQRKWPNTGSFH